MLDAKDIKDIIQLIDGSSFKNFKLEYGQCRLDMQKEGGENTTTEHHVTNTEKKTTEEVEKTEVKDVEIKETSDIETITSTMVGTFYSSSEPDAEPYVTIGDHVEAGTIVGVVEAMKLFNEVEANVEGEIIDVLVEDGTLVEHGQPLYKVKKS